MQITLKKYVLQLAHTFTISRESHDTQDTMIVCLSHNGKTGYGEATSNPYYNSTVESMMAEIEAVREAIEGYDFDTPENFYKHLESLGLQNFALCAMDLAANDLYGKLKGKPLYEIWGTNTNTYPTTNYTIGIDTVEKMVEKPIFHIPEQSKIPNFILVGDTGLEPVTSSMSTTRSSQLS